MDAFFKEARTKSLGLLCLPRIVLQDNDDDAGQLLHVMTVRFVCRRTALQRTWTT